MIELREVYYTYPDGSEALRNINMIIKAGERIGLLGPTGAGKTTLLMLIAGLYMPTRGSIHIAGLDTTASKNDRALRQKVNILFQDPSDQLFNLTVEQELAYGLRNILKLQGTELEKRISHTLKLLNMTEFLHSNPFHLSFGERKKIAFAVVLALDPEIFLLDEPTLGLDPGSRRNFIDIIKKTISPHKTLIISSHDIPALKQLCQKIAVFDKGQLIRFDEADKILQDSKFLAEHNLL